MGKSSINGPFSMAMLNNQSVDLVFVGLPKKWPKGIRYGGWDDLHCKKKTLFLYGKTIFTTWIYPQNHCFIMQTSWNRAKMKQMKLRCEWKQIENS